MASDRVKVYNTAHVDPMNFGAVPSTDGFVDIDSVQTVSNKIFVNSSYQTASGGLADPSRVALLMFKASILGGVTFGGQVVIAPGLLNFVSLALNTV